MRKNLTIFSSDAFTAGPDFYFQAPIGYFLGGRFWKFGAWFDL